MASSVVDVGPRLPVAVAGLAVLAAAAGRVTGLTLATPAAPRRLLPTALPILAGGAMTATSLAGRRLRDELSARRGEVEAALAVRFLRRDAVLLVGRPVAGTALVPPLDQTRTVGLVTLPGAFVGVLLGGRTPLQAGSVQLLVPIGLLAGRGPRRLDGRRAGRPRGAPGGPAGPGRPAISQLASSGGPAVGRTVESSPQPNGRAEEGHQQ